MYIQEAPYFWRQLCCEPSACRAV